ncbi:hypothetical protein ACFOWM_13415 [Ferruginibacter yonginensis]|uniref:Uncharacterized protein n=1 Tax=Ferruginibacter yonginensis TaxID=1310416 RepID=A0ABV8QVW7_9BACT
MQIKFWYCNDEFRKIWNKYDVYFSEQFCNYFSDNVERIFLLQANIKPSNKIGLSVFKPYEIEKMYEIGEVSKIHTAISILPEYIGNITFCWKSKSGRIIKTTDEDFDEADLECWIEGLNASEYWAYIGGEKNSHPFTKMKLPYVLKVYNLYIQMCIKICCNTTNYHERITNALSTAIEKFNLKSDALNGEIGYPHNANASINGTTVNYNIDLGSAGLPLLKKLLKVLAKFDDVTEVSLDF